MDLTASLLRVAGVSDVGSLALDGMDILDHVEKELPDRERTLFWRARRGNRTWRAVRSGDLKYIYRFEDGKIEEWLFDLAADSAEERNIIVDRPEIAGNLRERLIKWEKQVRAAR